MTGKLAVARMGRQIPSAAKYSVETNPYPLKVRFR